LTARTTNDAANLSPGEAERDVLSTVRQSATSPLPPLGPRILLVEDHEGLRFALSDRLSSEGYRVETAADGDEGLARALGDTFDLVILDVMLPRRDGFDVCRGLRQVGRTTPVLMLTACSQTGDRVRGLKLGADDYLIKPFAMAELLARVEARLRVTLVSERTPAVHRFESIEVDFRTAEVRRDGAPVALTAKEYRLLRYFVEHPGATLRRNELLDAVWGQDAMPTTRTVDVHVAWLRRKLEPIPQHPRIILTVHGQGYRFVGMSGPSSTERPRAWRWARRPLKGM
jgi:two-component system, OmpR family, alkaline phosphatase synthesis response regulator PhoP